MDKPVYADHGKVKFLTGKRNSVILMFQDYLFRKTSTRLPKTSWKCTASNCKIQVYTNNGIFTRADDKLHDHPPPFEEIIKLQTEAKMKLRLQTDPNYGPRQVHSQERNKVMMEYDDMTHLAIDSFQKCRSRLYRYKRSAFPENPTQRRDIVVPERFATTTSKSAPEPFLLIDDGLDERIMVFGTFLNLRALCDADYIVADGTFSVQPNLFAQLYVFHAPFLDKVFPALFCLLPDKTNTTYLRLLQLIRNCAIDHRLCFNPGKIHIDYEQAVINAISSSFSISVVQGCQFHYSQCLWRKVQEIGFVIAHNQNKDVKRWIRRLMSLPFLPIDVVDVGFVEVQRAAPSPIPGLLSTDQISAFYNYMIKTWMHPVKPMYSKTVWNQFNNEGPRTTNNAEGWHSKLNKKAKHRKTFFEFVDMLQDMQVDIEADRMKLITEPIKANPKEIKKNFAIRTAKTNFSTGTVPILTYLDSVSIVIKEYSN